MRRAISPRFATSNLRIDAIVLTGVAFRSRVSVQSDEKGPAARRRPMAAREAYSLYVERAVEGGNEADGSFSSL
jgi:hypothetical protein